LLSGETVVLLTGLAAFGWLDGGNRAIRLLVLRIKLFDALVAETIKEFRAENEQLRTHIEILENC
jgi:hypothetical protein